MIGYPQSRYVSEKTYFDASIPSFARTTLAPAEVVRGPVSRSAIAGAGCRIDP